MERSDDSNAGGIQIDQVNTTMNMVYVLNFTNSSFSNGTKKGIG
jgi:hypothetical protein